MSEAHSQDAVDVLVIGAGTAGAAAARACARAGLSVACIDRGPTDRAGARWVNGVPAWCFDGGGLAAPVWPERRGGGGAFHMVAGWGPDRIQFPTAGHLEVDMRALVARLQAEARAAGARFFSDQPALAWTLGDSGATVQTPTTRWQARWVVDAAGLRGTQGLAHPAPAVPRTELCVAAQEVRNIVDPAAARAFLDHHGVGEHAALVFTGIAGGYSIVNVQVMLSGEAAQDGPVVNILTGSIPGLGHAPGPALLARFVAGHPWIGPRRFGGSRAIPLVPPLARLDHGPLVRLGDAGRQVFAAHGSGIGAQLVAAHDLAATLSGGGRPWDWNVAWQRRWGGLFCGSVVFARHSRRLDPPALGRLLRSGLLSASLSAQALAQKPVRPGPADMVGVLRALPQAPDLLAGLAPVLARMARLELHHRAYPATPARLARWARHRDRLTGDAPAA